MAAMSKCVWIFLVLGGLALFAGLSQSVLFAEEEKSKVASEAAKAEKSEGEGAEKHATKEASGEKAEHGKGATAHHDEHDLGHANASRSLASPD